MSSRIPITAIIGLAASALAIVLWVTEQLTGWLLFEIIAIPVKLALLATPLFFLSDLSQFLHGRPKLAIGLGLTLVAVTIAGVFAFLPWRDGFAHKFNNDVYRWYSFDKNPRIAAEGDFEKWKNDWNRYVPHKTEAALVCGYYGLLIFMAAAFRLTRPAGAIVAAFGYLLLLLVPFGTGLIVLDYDTFFQGIIFDSIAMDLFPVLFWHAADYSIFFYGFMLIFFGICTTFINLWPAVKPAPVLAANEILPA